MAQTDSFLHLARPLTAAVAGVPTISTSPLNVVIHPQALLSILDHSTRRNPQQNRVIGTLLGTRNEDGSEVEIRNCYAVPHTESDEEVQVDMTYQTHMLALHTRANPKEVIIGWYATSPELNSFSPLIHNYYGQAEAGTGPHPAVHLTVSAVPGKDIEVRAYIAAPVGVSTEDQSESSGNRLFVPVPHEIRYGEPERSGLEIMSLAKDREDRSFDVLSDLESLEKSIVQVLEMLEIVSNHVNEVLDEEVDPSFVLGQYLMNALSLAPKVDVAVIEQDFNNHIQDVLAIAYLTNTIRTQIDLSNKLASATLSATQDGAEGTNANIGNKSDRQDRRGNKAWGGQRHGGDRGGDRH